MVHQVESFGCGLALRIESDEYLVGSGQRQGFACEVTLKKRKRQTMQILQAKVYTDSEQLLCNFCPAVVFMENSSIVLKANTYLE